MKLECIEAPSGELVLQLSGEMDAEGCITIRPALETVASSDDKRNIIINLKQVSFLDSSGIGAIVFLFKRLKANDRTLIIEDAQGQPRELIELLRIDSAIPVSMATAETKQCAN